MGIIELSILCGLIIAAATQYAQPPGPENDIGFFVTYAIIFFWPVFLCGFCCVLIWIALARINDWIWGKLKTYDEGRSSTKVGTS